MAALAQELEDVQRMIAQPGPFAALIHDDLSNARQTFEVEGRLMLLDWEQAKFGHALLDFVKPMVGKIEVELDTGISAWQCPGFPIALPDAYRRLLARDHAVALGDADWDANLSAALIFGALALAGRLVVWDPRRALRGTPQQNINGVLRRLLQLLPGSAPFPAMRGFLRGHLPAPLS
jgi:aminoglycoside phosphotransferase (APT) family kinase protein